MHEMYERIGVRRHGSFLVHGAIFKCNRDILKIGNPWAPSSSALELQNAETKRTATSSGAHNLVTRGEGQMRLPPPKDVNGERRIVATKGYSLDHHGYLQRYSICSRRNTFDREMA